MDKSTCGDPPAAITAKPNTGQIEAVQAKRIRAVTVKLAAHLQSASATIAPNNAHGKASRAMATNSLIQITGR